MRKEGKRKAWCGVDLGMILELGSKNCALCVRASRCHGYASQSRVRLDVNTLSGLVGMGDSRLFVERCRPIRAN
jgi:hypothetical protein